MYGFIDDYIPLNMVEILMRVTQEEIFHITIGEIPDINKKYISPIRDDRIGECFFNYYNGKLYFIDFANSKTHMDCFGIIQDKYNISLTKTLIFVNNHFKLGLNGIGTPVDIKFKPQDIVKEVKPYIDIIYKIKPYNKADIAYWNNYGINKENLIEDGILSVLWYKFYSNRVKREIIIRPKSLSFIYTEFFPKVKIYSPFEKKTNGKWIANVTQNDIGNIKNLPILAKKLIITKSYKDNRVLRNHGVLSIWFQNEGMLPDDKYLYNLGKRFDKIIVLFDNDKAGIIAAKKITQEINSRLPNTARYVSVPIKAGVKDPSDLYKHNRFELINFINKSNLL